MGEELKSCPFCGAKAELCDLSYLTGKPSWCISCTSSKCFAPHTDTCSSKKEAVKHWNNRPAEDALQKQIAELEKMAEARKLANRLLEQERNELEAERDRLREALKEIAKFADSEYEKRIPAPSCVEFSTVKRYAEKALKGAGE